MDTSAEKYIKTLGRIANIASHSEDVLNRLEDVLELIVKAAGSSSGWIFLRDEPQDTTGRYGEGFYLAAQVNLPAPLQSVTSEVWKGSCECQELCLGRDLQSVSRDVACRRFDANSPADPILDHHLSFPLVSDSQVLGVLNLVTKDRQGHSSLLLDCLTIIGAFLGAALDRKRLAKLVQNKRVREQAALARVSSKLLSHSTLEDIMSYLVEEVIGLMRVDACALLLPDKHPGYLLFRASSGWHSDPVVERRRIAIDERSSAGKVMLTQAPVLSDTLPGSRDMPEMSISWLEQESFRSTAAIPLVVEGRSIGSLVITDRSPRDFSDDDIQLLQLIANQAGVAIRNAQLQEAAIQRHRLEEELSIGRRIQRSLLPSSSPSVEGWEFSDIYKPAEQVGGDLYDYFELPFSKEKLGFVIGDVADKGVPAALFMAVSRTLIRSTALAGLRPASALVEANRLIMQDSTTDLFISVFYGILDTASGTFVYGNAGHNRPLLFRQGTGGFMELDGQGIVLCLEKEISIEEKSVKLEQGDILILYTDGVTEAMNLSHEEFGVDRLKQVVTGCSQQSADLIVDEIVKSVQSFIGEAEQSDDITLVVAKMI